MFKPKLSVELLKCARPSASIGLVCGLLLSACSGLSTDYQKGLYVAGGAGVSRLTPITDNTAYNLDDNADTALWASLGFDLTERLSAELHYAELGDAVLENTGVNGPATVPINYSAAGLSALYYALGDGTVLDKRQGGFAAYLRLGVSDMTHSADIDLDIDDSPQLWAGLGAEYMFNNALAARVEFSNYDGDAQALNLGAVYRFGARGSSQYSAQEQENVTEAVRERPVAPIQPPTDTQPTDQSSDVQAPEVTKPVTPQPTPQSPVETPSVRPAPNPPVASAPVSGVQEGIQFVDGTATLTTVGRRAVQALADQLKSNPSTRIELQAHADNRNGPDVAMQLTRQRVVSVARGLIGLGVPKSQLSARAFGSLQMLSGEDSQTGRFLDNRVELIILE